MAGTSVMKTTYQFLVEKGANLKIIPNKDFKIVLRSFHWNRGRLAEIPL